jgi:hypothetical protein
MTPARTFLLFVPRDADLWGWCRQSKACVASNFRRQIEKEAGDRGPDASAEASVAGFRGVLDLGLGVVDLADNLVLFGREFDADHETRFAGTGPGEPENHDRVIIPSEIQAGGRQALLYGPSESFLRGAFQVVKEHVRAHGGVARPERHQSAVK